MDNVDTLICKAIFHTIIVDNFCVLWSARWNERSIETKRGEWKIEAKERTETAEKSDRKKQEGTSERVNDEKKARKQSKEEWKRNRKN